MNTRIQRLLLLLLCLLLAGLTAGCRPSKKKVLSSTYYKELNKEYKKLQKENGKLKGELEAKDAPSEDEKRASDYLAKIARDRMISLEVGYADNMEGGELITDSIFFPAATAIAKRADLTSKYTPQQVEDKYGPGYGYILYDEDNAVYELKVYGGNYVVFTDLPNNVYYAYNAQALGDAFLHYKNGYPNSRLLHRLADSALVQDGKYCYENESAFLAANFIRTMDKKRSSRKKADKVWLKEYKKKHKTNSEEDPEPSQYEPKGKEYLFYHHGNVMKVTLYKEYLCILNMDGKETWYKADSDDIKQLRKQFTVPEEETVGTNKGSADSSGEEDQSHEKEIEEESAG